MRFRSGSYADLILSPASGGPRKGKEKRLTGDGREGQPRYTHARINVRSTCLGKGWGLFLCVCKETHPLCLSTPKKPLHSLVAFTGPPSHVGGEPWQKCHSRIMIPKRQLRNLSKALQFKVTAPGTPSK